MTVSTVTEHSVNLNGIAQTVAQAISTSLNPQAAAVLLKDGKTLRESLPDYTSFIQELAETLRKQDALLDYLDRELPKYRSNSSEDCQERARLLGKCINEAVELGVDVSDWLAVLKQKSKATPQVKENNLFGPKSLKAEDLLALLKELESACQKSPGTLAEFTELDKLKIFQKNLLSELNGLSDSPEHCELRGKIMLGFVQEGRELGFDVSGWANFKSVDKFDSLSPNDALAMLNGIEKELGKTSRAEVGLDKYEDLVNDFGKLKYAIEETMPKFDREDLNQLRAGSINKFLQHVKDSGIDVSGWTTSSVDVKDFLVKPQKGLTLEEFPDVKAAFTDAFNNTKNKIYDTLTIVQSKVAEFRSIILSSESLTKKS